MAYEVVMSYHLHMPSYFLGTFTEYPYNRRCVFLYPNHQKKNLSTSLKLAQISKPNNRNIPTI